MSREPRRTVAQVIASRRSSVSGGCCNRFADCMPCNCLAEARANEAQLSSSRSLELDDLRRRTSAAASFIRQLKPKTIRDAKLVADTLAVLADEEPAQREGE